MRIKDYAPEIAHQWGDIDWHNGDYHKLFGDDVTTIMHLAEFYRYRKPRNANGSRARYFFYAVQRALNAKE